MPLFVEAICFNRLQPRWF